MLLSFITMAFALEAGVMPINQWVQVYELTAYDMSYYTVMDAEVQLFDVLFIGGYSQAWFLKDENNHAFDDIKQSYQFRAGLRFENMELGFRHICGPHPVHDYEMPDTTYDSTPFEGAYEQIYIRFSITI